MTTLENRPNTALLVIDVQIGVVAERPRPRRGRRQRRQPGRQGAAGARPGGVGAARRRGPRAGHRRVGIVPELAPDDAEPLVQKNYGDSFEDTSLETCSPTSGSGGSSSRAPRPTRASARRSTARSPRLRRDPGQRRAHHRGPHRVGRAAARPGDRPHQPVLERPDRAGPHGRDGRRPATSTSAPRSPEGAPVP